MITDVFEMHVNKIRNKIRNNPIYNFFLGGWVVHRVSLDKTDGENLDCSCT